MTVVVDTRDDFTIENFRRVAVDGESVEIGPVARKVMGEARAASIALLDSDRTAFFYGITTRAGLEVAVRFPPRTSVPTAFVRRPLGPGLRGRVPRRPGGARDPLAARGLRRGPCEGPPRRRRARRGAARSPASTVPLDGQVGAGEVLPMRHVTMGLSDLEFEEGEGMALINGSPASSALLADAALHARHRLSVAEQFFALSIEAIKAPLEAYDEVLESLWGDDQETAALRSIRSHLDGAEAEGRPRPPGPGEFRYRSRLLGQAAERGGKLAGRLRGSSLGHAESRLRDADRARLIASGRVPSTGGYHNAAAPAALGMLSLAWAELAPPGQRQVTAMHLSSVSGLPHFLNPRGFEPDSAGGATNLFGWVAGSFAEEARTAAAPTIAAGEHQRSPERRLLGDVQRLPKERRAAECLEETLAILAIVSSQALYVTDRRPAPPLEPLLELVRSLFAPVDGKVVRDQGVEAGRLAEAIGAAALSGTLDTGRRGALCSWISAASVHHCYRRSSARLGPYCKLGEGGPRLDGVPTEAFGAGVGDACPLEHHHLFRGPGPARQSGAGDSSARSSSQTL